MDRNRVPASYFLASLVLIVFAACGKSPAAVVSEAPKSAFKESDFDADSDSGNLEVEVPVVVRDPFQKPGGAPSGSPERSSHHGPAAAEHRAAIVQGAPEKPPAQEINWPVLNLSGMVREEDGSWCASAAGRTLKVGDWVTSSIRILKTDLNGILLVHKSGETRRVTFK